MTASRGWRQGIGAVAACAAAGLTVWLLLPSGPITEMAAANSVRVRSPAIKAYEDQWWASAMEQLGRLCGTLTSTAQARYGFAVFVDTQGRIVRVEVQGDSFDATLAPRIDQLLRTTAMPAFTAQQATEKTTLVLRGKLFVDEGRCRLQRT